MVPPATRGGWLAVRSARRNGDADPSWWRLLDEGERGEADGDGPIVVLPGVVVESNQAWRGQRRRTGVTY
jgi:hypothetical protein